MRGRKTTARKGGQTKRPVGADPNIGIWRLDTDTGYFKIPPYHDSGFELPNRFLLSFAVPELVLLQSSLFPSRDQVCFCVTSLLLAGLDFVLKAKLGKGPKLNAPR